MNIPGVEWITYGTAEVPESAKFFEDCGLVLDEKGAFGANLRLADNTQIRIRANDDPGPPPSNSVWALPTDSIGREVVWGVADNDSLEEIAAEISKDREVTTDDDGVLHCFDDRQNAIGFAVTQRIEIDVPLPETNSPGVIQRMNRPADGSDGVMGAAQKIGHVVYWTPGNNEEAASFYLDRLGFKLTDLENGRDGAQSRFTRCPTSHDHHNLFLQQRGELAGYQHCALEVRDFDQVMLRGIHLEEQGWKSHIGPGRHLTGSNLSWYFWSPAGGMVEFYCDFDQMDDDWVPRVIDTTAENFKGMTWVTRPRPPGFQMGIWQD